MGRTLARTLPFVLAAVLIGAGAAYGINVVRKGGSPVASTSPSPSLVTESPTPSPLGSPSPSASATASPSPGASPSTVPVAPPGPVQIPSPVPTPATVGPAAYPPQITAGNSYSYRGRGYLAALAQDSRDSGTSICAGINESTQDFPSGYEGVFFVAVQFPDGNRLSAGYARSGSARFNFGELNNDASGRAEGKQAPATPGSHTYCVSQSGGVWNMTSDGTVIFSTTAVTATSTAGAVLRFENLTGPDPSKPAAAPAPYTLVIPGFHDITIDGAAPTRLTGSSFYLR